MLHNFINAFYEAAPYIHYLRGKTLVVGIDGDLLHSGCLNQLAADFNLMAALGVRLVLVCGFERQLKEKFPQKQNLVIDEQALQHAKNLCGTAQFDFQAALTLGVTHSPQRPPILRLWSGNFITAQPLGVCDGLDTQFAGKIRKTDVAAINDALNHNAVAWINPIAPSLSGQNYALAMPDTAQAVAVALQAEKLVFLTQQEGILNAQNQLIKNLTANEAKLLINQENNPQNDLLHAALLALENGISRVQILSGSQNGDLIRELFTRHGAGTSIARDSFMNVRAATESDIADIVSLIRPLEERGILIPRNHAYLAAHIGEFFVLEHDRQIYGCVALKQFEHAPHCAELACLVVSPEARDGGYGELLLAHTIKEAKLANKKRLFALSTHTADWFVERGFQAAQISDLPEQRQREYHENKRQSKIFVFHLD